MVRSLQNNHPYLNSNSSSLTQGSNTGQYNSSQLAGDALLESALNQATDLRSLAAMSIGSTAFSLTRSASSALLSSLVKSPSILSGISWGTALLGEVSAFRASNQLLSHESNSESWHDGKAFLATTMDFALLKGFSHYLRGETFIARHAVSASAMVAGELARERSGLSAESQHTFTERFVHAAVSSLALEAGGHLSTFATGGRLHAFERNIQSRLESELYGNSERRSQDETFETGETFASFAAEGTNLTRREFQVEERKVVLHVEGEASPERLAELEEQIGRCLQGDLILELEGIVTDNRFSKNQVRIFNFMSGRETEITITNSGEVRNIRITKDGREVFRLGEIAASNASNPVVQAAPTPVVETPRVSAPVEPAQAAEVARPLERTRERVVGPTAEASPNQIPGEIPTTLMRDRVAQGNIFTLNGLLADLIATQADWAGVREAAREAISESGNNDSPEIQRAKAEALVFFLQNAARFVGPSDVLGLISRIQRGDPITNVRKFAGALIASAEKRRATATTNPEPTASTPVEAPADRSAESTSLQGTVTATSGKAERVLVDERAEAGAAKDDNGREQGNEGNRDNRDSEDDTEGAEETSTPPASLEAKFEAARNHIDVVFQNNTGKMSGPQAGSYKTAQLKALRGIENAEIPNPQKLFLLEQFQLALVGIITLEEVSKIRERITNRTKSLETFRSLERHTTWKITYDAANRVFHKIIKINDRNTYADTIKRFEEILSTPRRTPRNPDGMGKMEMLRALEALESTLASVDPTETATVEAIAAEVPTAVVETPAAIVTDVVAAEVVAPETSGAVNENATRVANRQLIAKLPESLQAQAKEILNLIDRTYEIENVRKNPSLIVDAGKALPEREGAIRFAIARKKGRVDLNVKTSLETCKDLAAPAARIILEKQRELLEGKIESSELTRIRDRISNSAPLNAQLKRFEERCVENAVEWGLSFERLSQIYRRVILESDKAFFDRTRGRLVRKLEVLQSSAAAEIAQALQELCDAENMDHVLRGTAASSEAEHVEVTPETTPPESAAPVMDEGPVAAEEAVTELAAHDFSPAPAPEAVETHAPIEAPPVEAPREAHTLSEDHRALCERLSRPYNSNIPNELTALLNAGDAWTGVFAISIRIVERITSGERIALLPNVAASRLFLSLRKRSKSTPEAIQGELEKLERDLTPSSGSEGSAGGSDAPPPPAETAPPSPSDLPTSAEAAPLTDDAPARIGGTEAVESRSDLDEVATATPAPDTRTVVAEAPASEVVEVPATRVVDAHEPSEAERAAYDESREALATSIASLSAFCKKGLWKKLLDTTTRVGERIDASEAALGARRAAFQKLNTLLDPVLKHTVGDPQKVIDAIEALQREFEANPASFDTETSRALPEHALAGIRESLEEIQRNPDSLSGKDYQKAQIAPKVEAILTYLETQELEDSLRDTALKLIPRILDLRKANREEYDAHTLLGYLNALDRGLKGLAHGSPAEKVELLNRQIDALYESARALEPEIDPGPPDLELSKTKARKLLINGYDWEDVPSIVSDYYGRFHGETREGLAYLLLRSDACRTLCRRLFNENVNLFPDPIFCKKSDRFFIAVAAHARHYRYTDTALIIEIERARSLAALIDSDIVERLEASIAPETVPVVPEARLDRSPGDAAPTVAVETLASPPAEPVVEVVTVGLAEVAPERELDITPRDAAPVLPVDTAAPTKAATEVVPEARVVIKGSSPDEIFILANMHFSPAGRAAYDRFSDKARAGLAKILSDCRHPNRRKIIDALFTNVHAHNLREGNFLCRLFECIADCYHSNKVNRIYEAFVPGSNIDEALRDRRFQRRRLTSILAEYEMLVHYIARSNSKFTNLSEEYRFTWSSLSPAQRDYIKAKIDKDYDFNAIDNKANPDFRIIVKDGSSYIVEIKDVSTSDFSPDEEPLIRVLKQVFRYAIVRNTRPDQQITHAEFVIRADELEEAFVYIFREACETAELPFILAKYTSEGKLEVVDASSGLSLDHFANGREFIEARKPRTTPPTATIVSSADKAHKNGEGTSTEESASSRRNPSAETLVIANATLPPGVNIRLGANYRETISGAVRSFESVGKTDVVNRLLGLIEERADLSPAQRKALEGPLQRMRASLSDKKASTKFVSDLLEAAAVLSGENEIKEEGEGSNNGVNTPLVHALQTLSSTPLIITHALETLNGDLAVIEADPSAFNLGDLEIDSPDRLFAVDVIGETITLRQLQKELQTNGQLKSKVGVPVFEAISEYIIRYERLHAQLSSQAQQRSTASTSTGAEG